MTKKKEITLQDIFNQNDELYKNIIDCLQNIKEKIDGLRIEDDGEVKSIEVNDGIMITDKDYVTLKEGGCFVGGEPTTQYNGEDIYRPYMCVAYFKEARDIIREEYGYELLELDCLQSSTDGEYAKTGNPVSDKNGTNCWVRCVYKNEKGTPAASLWVFAHTSSSASDCALSCAYYCGSFVRLYSAMRSGLFGSVRNDVNKGDNNE